MKHHSRILLQWRQEMMYTPSYLFCCSRNDRWGEELRNRIGKSMDNFGNMEILQLVEVCLLGRPDSGPLSVSEPLYNKAWEELLRRQRQPTKEWLRARASIEFDEFFDYVVFSLFNKPRLVSLYRSVLDVINQRSIEDEHTKERIFQARWRGMLHYIFLDFLRERPNKFRIGKKGRVVSLSEPVHGKPGDEEEDRDKPRTLGDQLVDERARPPDVVFAEKQKQEIGQLLLLRLVLSESHDDNLITFYLESHSLLWTCLSDAGELEQSDLERALVELHKAAAETCRKTEGQLWELFQQWEMESGQKSGGEATMRGRIAELLRVTRNVVDARISRFWKRMRRENIY